MRILDSIVHVIQSQLKLLHVLFASQHVFVRLLVLPLPFVGRPSHVDACHRCMFAALRTGFT